MSLHSLHKSTQLLDQTLEPLNWIRVRPSRRTEQVLLQAVLPEGRLKISPNFFKISQNFLNNRKQPFKTSKQHIKAIFSLIDLCWT
jgi:hypothetical protein